MRARTAGDVLREALSNGTKKRTLARQLAELGGGSIESWRAALTRAQRGQDDLPAEKAAVVAKFFGRTLRQPESASHAKPGDRLRALEESDEAHTIAIDALRQATAILLEQVRELGGHVPELPSAALPPEAEGTTP